MAKFNNIKELTLVTNGDDKVIKFDCIFLPYVINDLPEKNLRFITTKDTNSKSQKIIEELSIMPNETLLIIAPAGDINFALSYTTELKGSVIVLDYRVIEKLSTIGPEDSKSIWDQDKLNLDSKNNNEYIIIHGAGFSSNDICCNFKADPDFIVRPHLRKDNVVHYYYEGIPHGFDNIDDISLGMDINGLIIYGPTYQQDLTSILGGMKDINME